LRTSLNHHDRPVESVGANFRNAAQAARRARRPNWRLRPLPANWARWAICLIADPFALQTRRVRLHGWRKRLGSIICQCGPDAGAEKGMPRDGFFGSGDLGQRLVILTRQELGP